MIIGIDARSLEGARTGVGRYLTNILERWECSKSHRFILYFKNSVPPAGIVERPCFEKKILRSPLGIRSNAFFQHQLLPRAARKDKVDMLFSPAYILPWNWSGKSVVTIHDISYEVYPEQISLANGILLAKASRHSAKIASRILTITDFSKQEIASRYGISPEKILVTPLGVDEKFMVVKDKKKLKAVKEKFGLDGDYVISVGSIFNRRHLPEAIIGFLRAAEKIEGLQFLIVGKNHTYPFVDIEKLISDVNDKLRRPAVKHADYADDGDLLWLYNGAGLSIYLSDYEGFGLPPLEGASCGVPAMVSDIPVEKEVMGEAAIFIGNNHDVGEISGKIIDVFTKKRQRNLLVKKGLDRVKDFSWERCAQETLEAIVNC